MNVDKLEVDFLNAQYLGHRRIPSVRSDGRGAYVLDAADGRGGYSAWGWLLHCVGCTHLMFDPGWLAQSSDHGRCLKKVSRRYAVTGHEDSLALLRALFEPGDDFLRVGCRLRGLMEPAPLAGNLGDQRATVPACLTERTSAAASSAPSRRASEGRWRLRPCRDCGVLIYIGSGRNGVLAPFESWVGGTVPVGQWALHQCRL